MAVRIKRDGTIVCAAKSNPEEEDTYVDDGVHYRLSVLEKVLIPDSNESENGLWYWRSEMPAKQKIVPEMPTQIQFPASLFRSE